MSYFSIVTDSSCDLPAELAKELDVTVLPLDVIEEGKEPAPNDKINVKEFYENLRQGKKATTSAVSFDGFLRTFDAMLADGNDILYIGFSSGLSGTFNAGFVASKELALKYPDRKIAAVDTLAASMGEGLLVYLAAQKRKEGADLETVYKYIEDNRLKLCHWFTVDDLMYLKRGGRLSATKALFGTMLSVKPILHVDNEGHLINVDKTRGRRNSVDALFNKMVETAIDPAEQVIFISHGDCIEDAEYLAEKIKNELHVKDVVISYVGPVIGAHSGPGTLALFFLGTER